MIDPKIIVAIDTYDYEDAIVLLDQLNPGPCEVKIGSVLFNALGKDFLRLVNQRGFKIFLDLKLNDIPNTVHETCLFYTYPSPRDRNRSRIHSSARNKK